MSEPEYDLKQKIMDIFGVTEEQIEEFEKATGFREAREAAQREREKFLEHVNIFKAHIEQGLVVFSESLAEGVRTMSNDSQDESGGIAVMKCRRCGDQITSRDVQKIIAWDKEHKDACTKPDGPLLPEEREDDEPMVKIPVRLAKNFHDNSQCRFDHNGDCQEHGFFDIEDGGCPQRELGLLLLSTE